MNKKLAAGIEWIFVLAILLFAYSLKFMTEKSIGFLIVLIIAMLWAVVYRKNFGKTTLSIMRILIGALFIFSGTVKGIDPLGTQFRIEDYLYAYNLPALTAMALFLSIFLNLVEFITGIMLIFNIKMKFTGILTMLMMLFFTFTTLYDALYSPVPDCGCFGDFIKLSNWQTFYKNLVINAFVLVIFFRRKDFENKFVDEGIIEDLKQKILQGHKDLSCPKCHSPLITRIAKMYDLEDNLMLHPKARCSKCVFQIKD